MTTDATKRRLPWVDAARGISIFLVVMVHTVHWLGSAGMETTPALDAAIEPFTQMRMPLFFFASGLLATKWLQAPWSNLLRSKVAVLAWTFLIWQVSVFAYKAIGGTVLPAEDGDLLGQVARVLVSPIRPNGELWFLWALALFFITGRVVKDWPPLATVTVAAVVSVIWSGIAQPVLGADLMRLMGPGLSKFPMYFVFFIGAALYSRSLRDLVARVPIWVAVVVAVAWAALFGWLDVLAMAPFFPGLAFAGQVAGVVGGLSFAVLLQWFRPLTYLGQNTLVVYLSHTLFIVLIACALYLGGTLVEGWAAWLVAVAVIGVGLLLGRVAGGTWLLQSPRWFGRWLAGDLRARALSTP